MDSQYARYGLAYRKFVRAQYEETQKLLKEKGIKAIDLYRGVKNKDKYIQFPQGKADEAIECSILLQPQSAFTTHPPKAFDFAGSDSGVVFKVTVPVERCLSTALSGVGCLDEHEVTVLGGPPQPAIAYYAKYWEDRKGKVGRSSSKLWKSLGVPRRISLLFLS